MKTSALRPRDRRRLATALAVLTAVSCIRPSACSSYDAFHGKRPTPGGAAAASSSGGSGFGAFDDGESLRAVSSGSGTGAGSTDPLRRASDEVQKTIANTKAMVHGAARHARWFNIANGLLLMVTGPFNIILSAITLNAKDLMTSVYLSLFGVLLVAMEVPLGSLQRPMRAYFLFLYTRFGRATFLMLVSNLAMVCGKVGFLTATLTICNAVLNMYLLGQNRDAASKEADLVSTAMAEVKSEMSGQFGGILGLVSPMRLMGGLGSVLPFGRRRRKRGGADDDDGDDAFENPFASDEQASFGSGGGGSSSGGSSSQPSQQQQPGQQQQQYSRRDPSEGPGGRSPFSSAPSDDALSPFSPRSAGGNPTQQGGSGGWQQQPQQQPPPGFSQQQQQQQQQQRYQPGYGQQVPPQYQQHGGMAQQYPQGQWPPQGGRGDPGQGGRR